MTGAAGRPAALAGLMMLGCSGATATVTELEPPRVSTPLPPSRSASVTTVADPKLPAEAIFVADVARAFPRRATLARFGNVRLSPELEPAIRASDREVGSTLEPIVLESGPDYIRVLHDTRGVRLALYLEAEDFREVPIGAVEAALSSVGEKVDARLVLQPGVLVEWTGERSGERRARVRERDQLEVFGWVRKGDIGRVYTPLETKRAETTHHVARRVGLHVSPTGASFGAIDAGPDDHVHVRALGDPKSGRRKIAAFGRRFMAEGWVDEKALVEDPGQVGRLGGSHTSWGGGRTVYLPAGTPLHLGPEGEQVGVTLSESRVLERTERRGGRRRAGVYVHGWGPIDLWAPDEAFERGARDQQARERRDARVVVARVSATGGFSDAQTSVELERHEIARCLEKAESGGASVRGELKLQILIDREGSQESLELSGPASKDSRFSDCLKEELRVWLTPHELRPRPGTVEATIEIGPRS